MDILAHGVYNIALQKTIKNKKSKQELLIAFLWGIAPDAIAFGIPLLVGVYLGTNSHHTIVGGYDLAHIIYPYTHSLVIFSLAFLVLYVIRQKWYLPMLGWGLHILIDIPLHTPEFFPTPFLFPLSDYILPFGIAWSTLEVWVSSWVVVSLWLLVLQRRSLSRVSSTSRACSEIGGEVVASTVWQNFGVMKIILQNIPTLDPLVILMNCRLYIVCDSGKIVSFATVKNFGGSIELGTVYTDVEYRGNGYASKIIRHIISKEGSISLLCKPALVSFYKSIGFVESDDCGGMVNLRRNLYNIFISPFARSKIVSLKYRNTIVN